MLGGLKQSLTRALNHWNDAAVNVNEENILALVKAVERALIEADVSVHIVKRVRDSVRDRTLKLIDGKKRCAKSVVKKTVHKCLIEELTAVLSPLQDPFRPRKGQSNVVMFVGLQGAGKTTSLAKYALYYKQRGFRVGVICADTFRAGAYEQLKQNAQRCKLAFYGDPTLLDAVALTSAGVAKFKAEKMDLTIIDTSGRHRQESELFEEMLEIQRVAAPDSIVYVIDAHIGQSCFEQAKAFRDALGSVSSIILTKLDSAARGGGALTSVVATGCPIAFVGYGEGFQDFEPFDTNGFIARLLDLHQDPRKVLANLTKELTEPQNAAPVANKQTATRLKKGNMTYDDMRSQLSTMGNMSSITSMMGLVPGLSSLLGGVDKDMIAAELAQFKILIAIIDSMTPAERAGAVALDETRKLRLAQGAGCQRVYVDVLIEMHRGMSKTFVKMGRAAAASRGKPVIVRAGKRHR